MRIKQFMFIACLFSWHMQHASQRGGSQAPVPEDVGELAVEPKATQVLMPAPVSQDALFASLNPQQAQDPRVIEALRMQKEQQGKRDALRRATHVGTALPKTLQPREAVPLTTVATDAQIEAAYQTLLQSRYFNLRHPCSDDGSRRIIRQHLFFNVDTLFPDLARNFDRNEFLNDAVEKLLQRFSQPLSIFEIGRRAKAFYQTMVSNFLYDFTTLMEVHNNNLRAQILKTNILRDTCFQGALDQMIKKVAEIWQRDTFEKIVQGRVQAVWPFLTPVDLQKKSNESFATYHLRLKQIVENLLPALRDNTNVLLRPEDSEKINKEVVNQLIEMYNRHKEETIHAFVTRLVEQLMRDHEFKHANMDVFTFLKNNPQYAAIQAEMKSFEMDLQNIAKAVEQKLKESESERLHRMTREEQKAQQLHRPGFAQY